MTALGASLVGDSVTFSVWAPRCRTVDAVLEGRGAPPPPARRRLPPGRDVRGDRPAPRGARRPRRHGARADAGLRVPGLAQLGLRRGPPLPPAAHARRGAG